MTYTHDEIETIFDNVHKNCSVFDSNDIQLPGAHYLDVRYSDTTL